MKKILLAIGLLIGSATGAFATCAGPSVMHDFPGTSFNMSLATNAGDGNCSPNVTIVGTLPAYTAIPAFKIDQTTPGTTNLVALAANQSVNNAQINGVTPLMGNGVTGTGSQRVTIASDNTAFSVNSTLSAETTKVIGTVRNLGNAGAITDFAGQNAVSPANAWLMGGQFNTTPTTLTTGNASPFQMDSAGNLLVNVKTGGTSGTVTQGSTTSGQSGNLIQGAVTTGSPSYSTATTNPLSLTTAGNLRVDVASTSASGGLQVQSSANSFPTGSLVDISNLSTPIAAGTATATKGMLLGGQFDSTQKTLTNGQQAAVSMSARGAAFVAVGADGFAVTVSGTPNYNLSQVNGGTTATAATGVQKVGIVGNAGAAVDAATAAAVPANAVYTGVNVGGNLTGLVGDPCQTVARSYVPVNISTATTTRIIAPTASKKTYICGMFLMAAGTTNVGIVEGTGGTCGTATAGVIGGTTATTGPNLTAQVGFVLPNTGYAQAATAGSNVDFCLITSAAIQLTGHVVYVQF